MPLKLPQCRVPSFVRVLMILLMVIMRDPAFSYPIIINSSHLTPLFGLSRDQLIAIRADDEGATRVALQVDEVEDGVVLVLREPYETRKLREKLPHPKRSDPFSGRLQSVHRIVLDDRDFSKCSIECEKKVSAAAKNICDTPHASIVLKASLVESERKIFIANCGIQAKVFPTRDIKHDAATRKITTPFYEYVYQSDKNIFFKEIKSIKSNRPALSLSELKAYLKPKYLFNMKFKDDDLISQITSISKHSQSLSLEVAVALNILAMKINNQICCDVSFFEDSLYFPVVLDLPFSGQSFAKGSGLFFGFQGDKESNVQIEFIAAKTNESSDAIIIKQNTSLIVIGLRNPNRNTNQEIRPKVVTSKEMENIKFMPIQSDSGIFYDIHNAKEGFQHFNIWMYFGGEEEREKLIEYAQNGPKINLDYKILN